MSVFETYMIEDWDSFEFSRKVTKTLNEISPLGKVSICYSVDGIYSAMIVLEKEINDDSDC